MHAKANWPRYRSTLPAILLIGLLLPGCLTRAASPYTTDNWQAPHSTLDAHIQPQLQQRGVDFAPPASEHVLLRRIYLDLLGRTPGYEELQSYFKQPASDRLPKLIDRLLQSEECALFRSLHWCDMLRVKAEFPINLWPNGVQAYHRWIYNSLRDNVPYDKMARAMLCSSGSNFRVAPVNFYRAMQGHEPGTIAQSVALTFLGTRLEKQPLEYREGLAAFFSRVGFKGSAEWKEEIVYWDATPAPPLSAVFPDGKKITILSDRDPRQVFTDWLLEPDNPYFARVMVNRQWAWLFGRGLVHQPDDFRPDNPPLYPEALDYLAGELVASGFDLRHTLSLILNSRVYQQSCLPAAGTDPDETAQLFACYPARQLEAEVILDSLNRIFSGEEEYSSAIPEPFTFIPGKQRSVGLADGSISGPFLELYGRPARDSGSFDERSNLPTAKQRMHLMNGSQINEKISRGINPQRLAQGRDMSQQAAIERLWLETLSRPPTAEEWQVALTYIAEAETAFPQTLADMAWALVNSREFLYRH